MLRSKFRSKLRVTTRPFSVSSIGRIWRENAAGLVPAIAAAIVTGKVLGRSELVMEPRKFLLPSAYSQCGHCPQEPMLSYSGRISIFGDPTVFLGIKHFI